jgi:hypothetical protein
MVVLAYNPSYSGGRDRRMMVHGRGLGKKHEVLSKNTKCKNAWGMAEVLSKHKALSSNPSTDKKKINQKNYVFHVYIPLISSEDYLRMK